MSCTQELSLVMLLQIVYDMFDTHIEIISCSFGFRQALSSFLSSVQCCCRPFIRWSLQYLRCVRQTIQSQKMCCMCPADLLCGDISAKLASCLPLRSQLLSESPRVFSLAWAPTKLLKFRVSCIGMRGKVHGRNRVADECLT